MEKWPICLPTRSPSVVFLRFARRRVDTVTIEYNNTQASQSPSVDLLNETFSYRFDSIRFASFQSFGLIHLKISLQIQYVCVQRVHARAIARPSRPSPPPTPFFNSFPFSVPSVIPFLSFPFVSFSIVHLFFSPVRGSSRSLQQIIVGTWQTRRLLLFCVPKQEGC